jgi:hypothetical protein
MNRRSLQLLAVIVAILAIALFFVESGDNGAAPDTGALLLPDFRRVANDVDSVTISRANSEPIVISKDGNVWKVAARSDYPARADAVRTLLLAMADAKIVEVKTANPELYDKLGVNNPAAESSKGVLVSASTSSATFDVIFGLTAQTKYRYARIADRDQSWMIDQNPDIPSTPGEWLEEDIIDVDASRVKAVTIRHPDGEIIRIEKLSEEDTGFVVTDIPEGRELSYSTVANGIGGALSDLTLDDVRSSVPVQDPITTEFETFDGLTIVAETTKADDAAWVSFTVSATSDDNENAGDINARVTGWQFKIADFKSNLLTRRWDDILKTQE